MWTAGSSPYAFIPQNPSYSVFVLIRVIRAPVIPPSGQVIVVQVPSGTIAPNSPHLLSSTYIYTLSSSILASTFLESIFTLVTLYAYSRSTVHQASSSASVIAHEFGIESAQSSSSMPNT